jgi:hypothetical protein
MFVTVVSAHFINWSVPTRAPDIDFMNKLNNAVRTNNRKNCDAAEWAQIAGRRNRLGSAGVQLEKHAFILAGEDDRLHTRDGNRPCRRDNETGYDGRRKRRWSYQ